MNGEVCCILGVCCPPLSQQQEDALVTEMVHDLHCTPEEARRHAQWTLKHFDLAPAGTLTALKEAIAKMARSKKGRE